MYLAADKQIGGGRRLALGSLPHRAEREHRDGNVTGLSIAEAVAALTAKGAPFEMEEKTIRGMPTRVWKNAPPSLRAVFEASRRFRAPPGQKQNEFNWANGSSPRFAQRVINPPARGFPTSFRRWPDPITLTPTKTEPYKPSSLAAKAKSWLMD